MSSMRLNERVTNLFSSSAITTKKMKGLVPFNLSIFRGEGRRGCKCSDGDLVKVERDIDKNIEKYTCIVSRIASVNSKHNDRSVSFYNPRSSMKNNATEIARYEYHFSTAYIW